MTLAFEKLLAKSSGEQAHPRLSATLPGHLAATDRSASVLCDASLAAQLSAFGLPEGVWAGRARRLLCAAALWHDIGKANDHFLGMLTRNRNESQALRHETVSLLLALREPLHSWLRSAFGSENEWHLFLWAVAGHHRKDWRSPPSDGTGTTLTVHTAHPDFATCLAQFAEVLNIQPPPSLAADISLSLLSSGAASDLRRYFHRADSLFDALSAEWKRFAALIKSALIAADVAASSQVKPGDPDPVANISRVPTPQDLESVISDRLGDRQPRDFQISVATTPGRVILVEAGCGTGKTLAAFLRAARNPLFQNRRLFFCYPTTGTATAGFCDYLFDSDTKEPKHDSRLFHSRAAVDATLILGQRGDEDDRLARADALSLWDTSITVCTVDTVLGLLQNQRAGHYLWPAIASAAFVFDEIHAYDDHLFATLMRFLRDLPGLPSLLMTASLPAPRLEAIRRILAENGESLPVIAGPLEIEAMPRYRAFTGKPSPTLRVLHVSNSVARCIEQAKELLAAGRTPLVYHSRFKYRDRVQRHLDIMAAFRSGDPAYACTTQVCEMSLDISAQLLVTDLAPVHSLIQRLGRLNRHDPDPDNPLPFHVLEPASPLPYCQGDLDLAKKWLSVLGAGPISQKDLVTAWEALSSGPLDLENHTCNWLDGGPLTIPASLREGSPNITVLMEEDVAQVKAEPSRISEFLLSMPPHANSLSWCRHKFHPVAPTGSIHYDALLGARWAA